MAMNTFYGNNRSILSHEILGEIVANGKPFLDAYVAWHALLQEKEKQTKLLLCTFRYKKELDPFIWAEESFLLARTVVVRC